MATLLMTAAWLAASPAAAADVKVEK